jgi:hypothetical protein
MIAHRTVKMLAALMVLFLVAALPAIAQVSNTAAALRGSVLDEQGGGVPNATVTVSNTALGLSKVIKTGTDGAYEILSLNPGTYRIEIEASGFQKTVADNVVLSVGQLTVYDAHMKVGAVSMVVEVSGNAAPLIDTEQTQQANTINPAQVTDLPNINRNFTEAVYTLPGVANSDAPRAQTPGFTGFFTTGFSIGGSNGRNNLSTIDGGENEYGTGQYRVSTYPLDAIQEYQVNRNAFAAEFGFTDGAAINIVTKTGTNQYHGSAFGYFYDRYTNAQSYFYGVEHATDPTFPTQPFSQNVYAGGSIGGPIVKDKFFFFLSYEGQKTDAALINPLLPSCEVQGLASATNPQCDTAVGGNPQTPTIQNNLWFAQQAYVDGISAHYGTPLIGEAISPALNPLTNAAYNQIILNNNGVFDTGTRQNNAVGRLDFVPSQKDSLSLRLGYARNNYFATGVDNSTLRVRDYSVLLNWTHTFSPTVVNQMLLQVVPWNRANTTQPDSTSTQEILVGTGPSGLQFAGTSSYYPYLAHQHRGQAEDNVTWNWKSHTIKFGGSLRVADYHVEEPLWVSGQYVFAGGFPNIYAVPPALQPAAAGFNASPDCQAIFGTSTVTGQSNCLDFVPGLGFLPLGPVITTASNLMINNAPFNWEQGFGNPAWQGWAKYLGLFVQDTWKITRNFTLTPGIRFDADWEPKPLHAYYYPEPRLGFSWDPFSDHKTVIRGGGGIYAAPIDVLIPSYVSLLSGTGQYLNVLGSQNLPGLTGLGLPASPGQTIWTAGVEGDAGAGIAPGTIPLGQVNGAQITALGIPTAPGTPGQTNQVIYNISPGYQYPYSIEASLSVQRQLTPDLSLEVAYNFYHAVHQQMPVETAYGIAQCNAVNPDGTPIFINPNDTAAVQAAAIPVVGNCYAPKLGGTLTNPNVTLQTTYASIGNSVYHGMTASLTKRYSHNLQLQANYTVSKAIDNFIDFASFQQWYRPEQLGLYRAVSAFNVPQRFVFNAVYNTPRNADGVLGAIYRNFTIAPIVTLQSGLPFTLLTQNLTNGPLGTAGTDIPGEDGNSAAPVGEKRDSNYGRPFFSWDMTVRKGFYLMKDEKLRMDFSVQVINILNRENFNNVYDNITGVTPATTFVTIAGNQTINLASLNTNAFTGIHGVKPTNAQQFNQAGFFAPAGGLYGGANYIPRQVEFGLRLTF